MDDDVAERIEALEAERRRLDAKHKRLCAQREVFWQDAQRLKHMSEGSREVVFRDLCREAGDAWEALMLEMHATTADTYGVCMDIIRRRPNAHTLSREFVRSCPYLVATKLDRDVGWVRRDLIDVNTRLNQMYDAGLRILESRDVSTSSSCSKKI